MRRRPLVVLALSSALALTPGASAAEPQVTDLAGDANFLNNQGYTQVPAPHSNTSPAGSQGYADVLSVLWEKTGSDVRVTANFTAPPAPPAPTSLVYRMLGTSGETCPFVGVVWYSKKSSDPGIPKAAVRDNCTGTTVLTEVPEPKIDGTKIIWTVPLDKFPKQAVGKPLTDLRVEIRELQDFGTKVPSEVPPQAYGGSYGSANGLIEVATSTSTFELK